jgi:hypothetical protein
MIQTSLQRGCLITTNLCIRQVNPCTYPPELDECQVTVSRPEDETDWTISDVNESKSYNVGDELM